MRQLATWYSSLEGPLGMFIEPGIPPPSGAQHPDASAVREQLARILDNPAFIRSDRISELLCYLVERSLKEHSVQPKETVLGVEVFGRTPGYDTQADPIVRVTARRLRFKLEQYYQAAGEADAVRMELLPGAYAIKFSFREQSEAEAVSSAEQQSAMASAQPLIAPGKLLFDRFHLPRTAVAELAHCAGADALAHPAFSPDGHAIAFDWRGHRDAAEGIYVQRLDAEGPARFSQSMAREMRPAWSPDGGRIAFVREIAEGRFEIHTAPAFGVGDCRLAEIAARPGDVPRVEWSPDGRVLVTSGRPYPESAAVLLLFLVDGGVRQQITVPPLGCWGDDEAIFSPAGNMLAFRRRTGPRTGDVYLHSMTTDLVERRLTWDECEICGIAWAPRGDSLIVSSRREEGCHSLWRISLSNYPPVRLTATGEMVAWPAVSRRSDRLAYVRQSIDPGAGELPAAASQIMVVEAFR